MEYKLQYGGRVKRMSDGHIFPADGPTPDTQEYLAWLSLGNVPDAADPFPSNRDVNGIIKLRAKYLEESGDKLGALLLLQTIKGE